MTNSKDEELRTLQHPVQADVESVRSQQDFDGDHRSEESIASIDCVPGGQSQPLPPSKTYHPFSPHVLALLIPFSIFGTLARLGLQALATYDDQSVFPLAYVQSTGCFVMGFFLRLKGPMGDFYAPLYTAITTGFCGSLTTFSGWQLDVFNSWINAGGGDRGGFQDFIDGLTKTVFTLSLSLGSMSFGSYLSKFIEPTIPRPKLSQPPRTARISLTILSILAYIATLPIYFRLPPSFRGQATAALLFAFPGTLTRYFLSIYFNPFLASLPLGTFMANMIGTGLLAVFHVLQNMGVNASPVSPGACSILQGLGDGYCGCLTTISTFAAEIRALRTPFEKVRYVLISWVVGQLLMLLVFGPALLSGRIQRDRLCAFE
ncbi:hypothetical protein E1B28_004293 [Marasmius oreades]|uniref:CrcB-like protein n=1 Tax=Marasmius oreades TaxID=181124 RepID=A0A9P7UYB4_9AGAR|nr:uncharacterized protein E1B28_004293 [Marasmius oreades]KAG7096887.1 hypothetical protein E1B28_004293 [Marasmius oreades]